jgi:hypothetical protein
MIGCHYSQGVLGYRVDDRSPVMFGALEPLQSSPRMTGRLPMTNSSTRLGGRLGRLSNPAPTRSGSRRNWSSPRRGSGKPLTSPRGTLKADPKRPGCQAGHSPSHRPTTAGTGGPHHRLSAMKDVPGRTQPMLDGKRIDRNDGRDVDDERKALFSDQRP